MIAETTTVAPAKGWLLDPRDRRVMRYAVGSTLAMGVAMGFAWKLSFLVPVLSLSFLASPGPRPDLKKGAGFVAVIAVSCIAGLWVIKYVLNYPTIFYTIFCFLLFRLFYAKSGGASPFLMIWTLIALMILPLISVQSPDLAVFVVKGIIVGAAVSILVVFMAYVLIPYQVPVASEAAGAPGPASDDAAKAAPPPAPSPAERLELAIVQTLVVAPMFILFNLHEWTGGILILVFVGMLSMQPAFAKDFKAGSAMLIGNLIGGISAVVVYQLLVYVPSFPFLLLITLLSGLIFGSRLMSNDPKAALYGTAYSTLLLVIGSTTAEGGQEATAKVYDRILQMTIAVTYVVLAFGFVDRYRRAKGG